MSMKPTTPAKDPAEWDRLRVSVQNGRLSQQQRMCERDASEWKKCLMIVTRFWNERVSISVRSGRPRLRERDEAREDPRRKIRAAKSSPIGHAGSENLRVTNHLTQIRWANGQRSGAPGRRGLESTCGYESAKPTQRHRLANQRRSTRLPRETRLRQEHEKWSDSVVAKSRQRSGEQPQPKAQSTESDLTGPTENDETKPSQKRSLRPLRTRSKSARAPTSSGAPKRADSVAARVKSWSRTIPSLVDDEVETRSFALDPNKYILKHCTPKRKAFSALSASSQRSTYFGGFGRVSSTKRLAENSLNLCIIATEKKYWVLPQEHERWSDKELGARLDRNQRNRRGDIVKAGRVDSRARPDSVRSTRSGPTQSSQNPGSEVQSNRSRRQREPKSNESTQMGWANGERSGAPGHRWAGKHFGNRLSDIVWQTKGGRLDCRARPDSVRSTRSGPTRSSQNPGSEVANNQSQSKAQNQVRSVLSAYQRPLRTRSKGPRTQTSSGAPKRADSVAARVKTWSRAQKVVRRGLPRMRQNQVRSVLSAYQRPLRTRSKSTRAPTSSGTPKRADSVAARVKTGRGAQKVVRWGLPRTTRQKPSQKRSQRPLRTRNKSTRAPTSSGAPKRADSVAARVRTWSRSTESGPMGPTENDETKTKSEAFSASSPHPQ
ncbi:hypothetical protein K438DRAFT_1748333 [Mycena galopus ATCC 62051]|nr:hypothetical protein K438DRAFT_1748333 [Mycena galopus ATCC 62051]